MNEILNRRSAIKALQIDEPDKYWCQIQTYVVGHSTMYIEVSTREQAYYLHFPALRYFSGPLLWQGADFHIAASSECLRLARSMERFDPLDDDIIINQLVLYQIEKPRLTVQIISGPVERVLHPPRWIPDNS